ncbi:TlpA disulfide reductase family protein [Mucilaginibacter sp. KACC 22063]|uniref:TlpA disulfide reductase family protein n=1 Tax=Mucilaginibacter sp. KACC 22063 TaxID=3025666 RepID=UPI00236623D1|nr:TlpA disulfide reductase family protein [Mucilaginibacter sp. KACC 22063]WDF56258.1 TlpA disulfide reductase family protein [Mucilaginibacter sp. KACC 22063]
MKRLIIGALSILPILAFGQTPENFNLKANVANVNAPAKAYLVYKLGANNVIDSAIINQGAFQFSGEVLYPTNAILVIDHKAVGFSRLDRSADALSFYLEKGDINVNGKDSIATAQITGSQINDDNKKLMSQMSAANAKAKKIYDEAQAATPAQKQSPDFQNNLQTRFKSIQIERENDLKSFIQSNPKSFLSLLALSSLGGPSADPAMLDKLYSSLDPTVKETEPGKVLGKTIEGLKVTAIGSTAPDFELPDVNGKPVKLSSFKGKYVLLDFWASWCPPCRQENPNVVKAFNRYKTKNFTIVGVSLDKPGDKANWQAAIKNDGLTWTQVSDLKFWDSAAAQLYQITSIPQNYLIDPQGKIIAKNLRGSDLESKLAELFGKI